MACTTQSMIIVLITHVQPQELVSLILTSLPLGLRLSLSVDLCFPRDPTLLLNVFLPSSVRVKVLFDWSVVLLALYTCRTNECCN